MPHFLLEDQASGLVVGIDEVGRGPWAGPVVACAFTFRDRGLFQTALPHITDSKKLSGARRESLSALFTQHQGTGCFFALGESSVAEIDKLNIRAATFLAMQRAYQALGQVASLILVDGCTVPDLPAPAQAVVRGDAISYSIAAASIIAKVARDKQMSDLAQIYPDYAWERNAGYGTQAHQTGLQRYGVTPHHRRSFAPIARLIQESAATNCQAS